MHCSTADYENMFHEITRIPTPEHDDKRVLKKKHVGNDAGVFDIMLVHFLVRCLFVCWYFWDTVTNRETCMWLADDCGMSTRATSISRPSPRTSTTRTFSFHHAACSACSSSELWGLPVVLRAQSAPLSAEALKVCLYTTNSGTAHKTSFSITRGCWLFKWNYLQFIYKKAAAATAGRRQLIFLFFIVECYNKRRLFPTTDW